MFLFKKKITTNSSRHLQYLKFNYKLLNFKWFKLKTYLKGNFGLSFKKTKLLRNRSRGTTGLKFFKINHSKFYSFLPMFSSGFILGGKATQFNTLLLQSSGLYYIKKLSNLSLFYFHFTNIHYIYPLVNGVVYTLYLGFMEINSTIHMIQNIFAEYPVHARALGSFATILSRGSDRMFFLVELPSGFKKLFFILTQADFFFKNEFLLPKKSQKAGFYIKRGKKPTVRGIAMNPVDHPHGGRTKTIRLSKTPWGWNTKA